MSVTKSTPENNRQLEQPATCRLNEPGSDTVTPELIVSAIKYEAPVGKCYGYANGDVTKALLHRSKKAIGETRSFTSFKDFVNWRKPLPPEYMLVSGTFEKEGEITVVHKGEEKHEEVSATKKYLTHREQPGILIGDIDFKEREEVAGLFYGGNQPYKTKKAALDTFFKVCPEAKDCALLVGWSTSSNLFHGEKQVKGKGGIRLYLPVTDASKIPSLLNIMHKRSWLHGEGWAFVDRSGKFQERSFFDMALKTVTQPDYAAPNLRDGLTQDREWEDFNGKYLDPDTVALLTSEEEAAYQSAVAAAKKALAPEMEAQRRIWLNDTAKKYEKRDLVPARAMAAAILLLDNRVLLPNEHVFFDDGDEVSVLDLLTDGSGHDGKTCRDPVEPDYNGGASVGKFYWNDGEGPGIHSFAHGSKWYAIKHDVQSLAATIEGGENGKIILAYAQTHFESETEKTQSEKLAVMALGLGQRVKPFRSDVNEVKKRIDARSVEYHEVITEGRLPIDKPLSFANFPVKKGNSLLSHAKNYKTMMEAYGFGCSYDVIKKEILWTGPQVDMTTDNAYLALYSMMKGLAALNGLPHGAQDLNAHLPAIAEENQINPVRDYLTSLKWDGQDRIGLLVQAMEPKDPEVAEIALRIWLTGAAAACEHFESGLNLVQGARPSFEYVLAILGEQGVNKTKGFLGLIPKPLAKYAKDGLSIKTSNKDSVKIAVSYWLVELGELDATFRLGQIAELKAFLSTEADELRLPYAQGYSKFKRRTAFMGTVNQEKFLKDATGNRRYLALACTKGFPLWNEYEVDQLWAQAWAMYVGGAQWWPTEAEQKILDKNAERYRQYSWAETRIREIFDFTHFTADNKRLTSTQLWEFLHKDEAFGDPISDSIREYSPQQSNELLGAMKKLWSENGALYRNGVQVVDTPKGRVKTYADGGKNKGWLVPMTASQVKSSELKNGLYSDDE